jgi:hemerythrin
MALIIWLDRYDTGIDEVDIQHRKLVGLINTLFDSISLKDRKVVLNQTLTELVNYTIYHFKLEEELMKKRNYPHYLSHKGEHTMFVENVNKHISNLKTDDTKALLDVINFLKDWLLKHILVSDKKYAEAFRSNNK